MEFFRKSLKNLIFGRLCPPYDQSMGASDICAEFYFGISKMGNRHNLVQKTASFSSPCVASLLPVKCPGFLSQRISLQCASLTGSFCMAQHYDVVVIGGGHNGLVNAAYLAKAGKKVLVLERRGVLGGAAVTEEVIPGFLFSECSYVVSLLRPEIIRELDLPRHGLEILPLDGTFSPMLSGDYLWRVNDHAKTQREIRRHSRLDAEAYDEFSKMMTPLCRFVKPMLSMIPPDPTTLNPKDLKQLNFLLQRFRELSSDERYTLVQLMTMSAAD